MGTILRYIAIAACFGVAFLIPFGILNAHPPRDKPQEPKRLSRRAFYDQLCIKWEAKSRNR